MSQILLIYSICYIYCTIIILKKMKYNFFRLYIMSRPKRNAAVEANNILFGLNEIFSSDDSSDEENDDKDHF